MWKEGSDLQLTPPFLLDPVDPVDLVDPLDPAENSGSFILAIKNNAFDNFSWEMLPQSPASAWLGLIIHYYS